MSIDNQKNSKTEAKPVVFSYDEINKLNKLIQSRDATRHVQRIIGSEWFQYPQYVIWTFCGVAVAKAIDHYSPPFAGGSTFWRDSATIVAPAAIFMASNKLATHLLEGRLEKLRKQYVSAREVMFEKKTKPQIPKFLQVNLSRLHEIYPKSLTP